MTLAERIFNEKAAYNKWLTELTVSEKALIIEMIDDVLNYI